MTEDARVTDPLDPTVLLEQANPVPSYEIAASRLDELVSGAVAGARRKPRLGASPPRQTSVVRRPLVATIAVSAAVVVGILVATTSPGGGPAVRPLKLKAVELHEPTGGAQHGGPGRQSSTIVYVAGPDISTQSGTGEAFSVGMTSDVAAQAVLVAKTLGVTDPTVAPTESGRCGVDVVGESSSVWTTCTQPVTWTYNIKLPSCQGVTRDSAGQLVPCTVADGFLDSAASSSQLLGWSSADALALLPSGLTLGPPTPAYDLNWINYPCELDGVPIVGCTESFQYSNAGTLLYATGPIDPAGPIASLGTYPLQSPASAIAELPTDAVTHGRYPSSITVTLVSSQQALAFAQLDDGSWVLVPSYVYTDDHGGTYSALAVSPADVQG